MFKPKNTPPKPGSDACDYFNEYLVAEMRKEASQPLDTNHLFRAGLACSAGHVVSTRTRPGQLFFVSPEEYAQEKAPDAPSP